MRKAITTAVGTALKEADALFNGQHLLAFGRQAANGYNTSTAALQEAPADGDSKEFDLAGGPDMWTDRIVDKGATYDYKVHRDFMDWTVTKEERNEYMPAPPCPSLQTSLLGIDHLAPNFSGDAVVDNEIGVLNARDYIGKWVLIFFYPKDFTFVCPTEIIDFSDRAAEFRKRGCEVIGVSCDSAEVHLAWIRTSRKKGGLGNMQIPLIADVDRRIASAYGALNNDNFPNRATYLINPEGVLKSMQINQNDVGRSVDEFLRLLDAYQFVAENGVVCPANWKPGAKTMIADPDRSLEYFESAEASEAEADFGQSLTPVKDAAHFNEVISSGKKVVVDFMAPWCGKCRMIAPTVEQLQDEYSDIEFVKFDTTKEELESLTQELGVKAMPVFKFYKDGKEVVENVIGYKKKPLQEAVASLSQA